MKSDSYTLIVDERLREKEFGILDRLTAVGIRRHFPDQAEFRRLLGKFYHRPPGGESWCDVILRLRSATEMLSREYYGERVLIVCHAVVVLCMRYIMEHLTESELLATVTFPPSNRASLRVTLSPKPVPLVLLVAVCSACQKGSKTSSMFSAAIPTPVSAIRTSRASLATEHSTRTSPLSVNLIPLERRLTSICRSFVPSV